MKLLFILLSFLVFDTAYANEIDDLNGHKLAIDNNGALSSNQYNSPNFPHDWTEGVGSLSSTLTIPAPISPLARKWFYVQNRSSNPVTIQYQSKLADGVTDSYTIITLNNLGVEERGFAAFVPQGIIKVISTSGSALTIMEVKG